MQQLDWEMPGAYSFSERVKDLDLYQRLVMETLLVTNDLERHSVTDLVVKTLYRTGNRVLTCVYMYTHIHVSICMYGLIEKGCGLWLP